MNSEETAARLFSIAEDRLRNRPGAHKKFRLALKTTAQGQALMVRAQAIPLALEQAEQLGSEKATRLIAEHLTSVVDSWAQSQPLPKAVVPPPLREDAMSNEAYQHIRSYCFDDLKAYIGTPSALAALQLASSLHGPAAAIMRDKQHGLDLYECHDLTPRERAAAHLLAVISNHRAATWWREPDTPDGSQPAAPLEPEQLHDAWRQTREAVERYAALLPEREAEVMIRMAARPAAAAAAMLSPDEASSGAIVPVHNRLKNRSNALAAVIEKAKQQAVDSANWQSVWNALVVLAQSADRPAPLLGYIEGEGVKYQTDKVEKPVAFFTRDACRKRLHRNR